MRRQGRKSFRATQFHIKGGCGGTMRFKGIIFDLDGTVLNTLKDLADSVNTALEQYGLPGHETEDYRYMVGKGFANLIDTAVTASIRKMQAPAESEQEPQAERQIEEKPVLTEVADAVPDEERYVTLEEAVSTPAGAADLLGQPPVVEDDVLPSGRMTELEQEEIRRGVLEAFLAEYDRRYLRTTAPYPGVQSMLSHLQDAGIKLAVHSNKRDDYTKDLISRNFPDIEWTCVMGNREDIPRKPDPAGAQKIAAQMGIFPKNRRVQTQEKLSESVGNPFEKEEPKKGFLANLFSRSKEKKDNSGETRTVYVDMAYIGDSNVDIQTAKNAGMTAIGVAWGFRGRQELVSSGADYIADDPFSLEEYLLKG